MTKKNVKKHFCLRHTSSKLQTNIENYIENKNLENPKNSDLIKEKENNLQQLLDAIDQIPTIILLWDKDNKLIHSNAMAKSNAKLRLNVELRDGITRKEYVMYIIKNGLLEVPKGMTENEFIDQREKEINNFKDKQRFETTFTDGVTFAGLFNKFPDGSYIQIFDDITDLKEKEHQISDQKLKKQSELLFNGSEKILIAKVYCQHQKE